MDLVSQNVMYQMLIFCFTEYKKPQNIKIEAEIDWQPLSNICLVMHYWVCSSVYWVYHAVSDLVEGGQSHF